MLKRYAVLLAGALLAVAGLAGCSSQAESTNQPTVKVTKTVQSDVLVTVTATEPAAESTPSVTPPNSPIEPALRDVNAECPWLEGVEPIWVDHGPLPEVRKCAIARAEAAGFHQLPADAQTAALDKYLQLDREDGTTRVVRPFYMTIDPQQPHECTIELVEVTADGHFQYAYAELGDMEWYDPIPGMVPARISTLSNCNVG